MMERQRFSVRRFLTAWWPALLGGALALGLLNFTYFWLDDVVRGVHGGPWPILAEEITAATAAALLLPFIVWTALRWPPAGDGWVRRLPTHFAALLMFSALRTTWNWSTRSAVFPLAGFGAYDYGAMPTRYFMELPADAILYVTVVALTWLVDHWMRTREQELALSRLETRLAESRLQALRAQLHPHFLFNTLNAISSVMYYDAPAADANDLTLERTPPAHGGSGEWGPGGHAGRGTETSGTLP
jgi:two-component system, LytTR family, sensor kinase